MLELPFNEECFDVVIEKGTMVNRHNTVIFILHSKISVCHSYLLTSIISSQLVNFIF